MDRELRHLRRQLKKLEIENVVLRETNNNLESENKDLKLKLNLQKRGSRCSYNGNNYEKKIFDVVKKCTIDGHKFNTQDESDLAGSSAKNDLECTMGVFDTIGLEVKKHTTPDWMQCSIIFDTKRNIWVASPRGKTPKESREYFGEFLKNV